MPKIKVLPEDVARQIAAGEVVERPASVVKELLENSLDAGARSVWLRTEAAGMALVEVRDDGCGMGPEDVALAAKSFATSKIASAADLFTVGTYGFRGEALSSISSVSRLGIASSDRPDGEGWRITIEGKEIVGRQPAAHEQGTTVTVRDLFFNTPARKKFLKSESTERTRILDTVVSFALVHPEIELHYSDDGRSVMDLSGAMSWRERATSILGSATMKHMVDVDLESPPYHVRGLVSLPTHTRSDRNHLFLYVNRRPVKERTMFRAIQEAYRTVIPPRRFPVVLLSLELPQQEVDINVHPTKLEVRLSNPHRAFEVVHRAIKNALSPHAEAGLDVSYAHRGGTASGPASAGGWGDGGGSGGTVVGSTVESYRAQVRDAYSSYMERGSGAPPNPQLSLQVEEAARTVQEAGDTLRSRAETGLFWQFNNAYIFIQVRGGIVVIDQHAAHERIIYDTSKSRLESEIPVSQQILFPIHLELSLPELEVFRGARAIFDKLGFHLEPFGGTSILVRGYPQGLRNWEDGKLLRQIFDDIVHDRFPGQSHADRIIASFACRSAVRAGQKLSIDEMTLLADQLFAVPNPYSCPHGRPTIQRLALEEIEGWFLRR
jgi:DNA mismatch repair protein MutL